MPRKRKRKHQGAGARPKPGVISAFPPELETETRELYDWVARGAEPVLVGRTDPKADFQNENFRRQFYVAAHDGFKKAQGRAFDRLLAAQKPSRAAEMLIRKSMDAMAWQMIGEQLYIARRLFRGHAQPTAAEANLSATRLAADDWMAKDSSRFALLSDLTTFVQVGDLLARDPATGLEIVEVKEGEKNKEILDFAQFITKARCGAALQFFREDQGETTYRQLGRVMRQHARMHHVTEVINTGAGKDPDTNHEIIIPSDPIVLDSWDEGLDQLLEDSKRPGWAISVIDDCLFVATYRDPMRLLGPHAFRAWFEGTGGQPDYPKANLVACMLSPLALPIFSRHIQLEHKFDVLFGRAVVYIGLRVDKFLELMNSMGIPARWGTRKETAKIRQLGCSTGPCIFGGRALVIANGDNFGPISDGILTRMFFHGTTPFSTATLLGATSELLTPPNPAI